VDPASDKVVQEVSIPDINQAVLAAVLQPIILVLAIRRPVQAVDIAEDQAYHQVQLQHLDKQVDPITVVQAKQI
jgi:hypothetical protein